MTLKILFCKTKLIIYNKNFESFYDLKIYIFCRTKLTVSMYREFKKKKT